jgi:hypothetical protein
VCACALGAACFCGVPRRRGRARARVIWRHGHTPALEGWADVCSRGDLTAVLEGASLRWWVVVVVEFVDAELLLWWCWWSVCVGGGGRALLDRKPYPRDQAVLSRTMVRNMVCHAAWQLVVLSTLIFSLGDVCEGHGNVCTGKVSPPPPPLACGATWRAQGGVDGP